MITQMRFRNALSLASLTAAAALAIVPALSQAADAPTITVKYAGLNLETAAGAHALYSRLQSAASSVCSLSDKVDPMYRRRWEQCFETTLATVVRSVNRPQLTLAYAENHNPSDLQKYGIDTSIQVAAK